MNIEFSSYTLIPKKRLNNFSDLKEREGFYLRLDKKYYLDYHPWVEFGDKTCEQVLQSIRKKGPGQHMLDTFKLDRRKNKITHSSFKNHGLNALAACSKMKVSNVKEIEEILEVVGDRPIKLRFDLNNNSSLNEIKAWWDKLGEFSKKQIEYIEDPFPNIESQWRYLFDLGVPLACDRNNIDDKFYDYQIFKPNVDFWSVNTRPQIFSSYMGSDLGRYHTYLALMEKGNLSLFHGIDTPDIYEDQLCLFFRNGNVCKINEKAVQDLYKKLEERVWTSLS